MLAELLEYAITPCPRFVRRMGYLHEAIAIRARAGRCRAAWESHLRRTRAVIRRAAGRCSRRRKAVVLGSGLLLDVPLADLARAFREVVLVDLVHPLGSAWKRRRYSNVRAVRADITGVAEAVWLAARDPGAELPRAEPSLFCNDEEVDLVVSANLLSQLPYLPVAYLERAGVHPPEAVDALARDIVTAHLRCLRQAAGVAALVTDVEELKVDVKGSPVSRVDTLHGVAPPPADEEWDWQLAPLGEASRKYGFRRCVIAVTDLRAAENLGNSVGKRELS